MRKVIIDMGLSLDGFATDPDGAAMYPIEELHGSAELNQLIAQAGAVVMGRGAYYMGDPDGFVDYEYQVPIFVVTHAPPIEPLAGENGQLSFTFVTDGFASAVEQAKQAAGDRNVSIIGGAHAAQECLRSGLVDELIIRLVPHIAGGGTSLLDRLDPSITLTTLEASSVGDRVDLRYSVSRPHASNGPY